MSMSTLLQRWIQIMSSEVLRHGRRSIQRTMPGCRPRVEELETRLTPSTTVSIANASTLEPAPGGMVDMMFKVTRTGDLSAPLTVGYTTLPSTAQAGRDFTPTTGTTTFAAHLSTTTIGVPILGNGVLHKANLSFSVKLTGIINGAGLPITLANSTNFGIVTPGSVAVGDLNGDGKPDVVIAEGFMGTIAVFMNTTAPGAATPRIAAPVHFRVGIPTTSPEAIRLAIGDLNGDGKPDVAVTVSATGGIQGPTGTTFVAVLLNTTLRGSATPRFASPVLFPLGNLNPVPVAIGDLNGDGKPDLVVGETDSSAQTGTLLVLLNTTAPQASTPTFSSPVAFTVGAAPASIAIGDINGDGKPDVAAANEEGNTVSVLLNTTAQGAATPTFAARQDFATGDTPISVLLSDIDGDGKIDLVVANEGSSSVSVLLNTTAPGTFPATFAPGLNFATDADPFGVAVGDLNGDGNPDLVTYNFGGTVSVLQNTTSPGSGVVSFLPFQNFAAGDVTVLGYVETISGAVVDLNRDGSPDIVVVNQVPSSVSVLTTKPMGIVRGTAIGTIVESNPPPVFHQRWGKK